MDVCPVGAREVPRVVAVVRHTPPGVAVLDHWLLVFGVQLYNMETIIHFRNV